MYLLHYLYLLPCLNNIYKQNMVNLRDRDNLRRKDKRPVPKVSFVRRFDCSYFYEIFATCSCTFFITKVYFFYVDYDILYEELLVRAKKHKSCCIYMTYVHVQTIVHTCKCIFRFHL